MQVSRKGAKAQRNSQRRWQAMATNTPRPEEYLSEKHRVTNPRFFLSLRAFVSSWPSLRICILCLFLCAFAPLREISTAQAQEKPAQEKVEALPLDQFQPHSMLV